MAAYAWTKDCHCLTLSSYFFTHLLEIGDRAQILHLNICQFIAAWRSKSATASSFLIGAGYRVQWLDVMMSKLSIVQLDAGTVMADVWLGASQWGISKSDLSGQSKGLGYNFKKHRSSYKKWLLSIIIKTFLFVIQSGGQRFWQVLLQTLYHLWYWVWSIIQRPICTFISSFWSPLLSRGQCIGNDLRNVRFP